MSGTPKTLRVVSDGLPSSTRLFVGDEEIGGVKRVDVAIRHVGLPLVTIQVYGDVQLVQRHSTNREQSIEDGAPAAKEGPTS